MLPQTPIPLRHRRYTIEQLETRRLLTVLTFEPGTTDPWFGGDGPEVSQDYGDAVVAAEQGGHQYGWTPETSTPNVTVSYRADGGKVRRYHDGYGDLKDVIYADDESDGILRVILQAAPGHQVVLHSAAFAWFGAAPKPVRADSVQVLDGRGALLHNSIDLLIGSPISYGSGSTIVDFGAITGSTLQLRIDTRGFAEHGDNIGIDNIEFSEIAVPDVDPTSIKDSPLYVIVHGKTTDELQQATTKLPSWVPDMAKAINARMRLGYTDGEVENSEVSFDTRAPRTPGGVSSFLLYNWAAESGLGFPGTADDDHIAGTLASLVSDRLSDSGVKHIHFIGFSRGCYVANEAIRRIKRAGLEDSLGFVQLSMLDPQQYSIINRDGILESNPGGIVDYTDNYYQTAGSVWPDEGEPVNGAVNFDLTDFIRAWAGRNEAGEDSVGNHDEVHDWYHWTIDPSLAVVDHTDLALARQRGQFLADPSIQSNLFAFPIDMDLNSEADFTDSGRGIGFHWSIGETFARRPSIGPAGGVDVVFVIDTTGSMVDDLVEVKTQATELVIKAMARNDDTRFGVVAYRDQGDEYVSRTVQPMTADPDEAIAGIQSLTTGGGGDIPEAVYSGLMHALDMKEGLGGWRDGVTKRIVLFGDAAPHDPEPFGKGYKKHHVLARAYTVDPADVFAVVVGGDANAASAFTSISQGTRGQTFLASTAGDVVEAITEALAAATPPAIAVSTPTLAEGDAGSTGTLTFTLSIANPALSDIILPFTTVDGTAVAGMDYEPVSGTTMILAGQTTATIGVAIRGDGAIEPDERFYLRLTPPANATLASADTAATIVNDDPGPDLSVGFATPLPSAVMGGAKGSATLRVTNGGDLPAVGPAGIRLFASADGVLDGGDVEIAVPPAKPLKLKPGAGKAVKLKFVYPANLPDGSYYLLATVNHDRSIAETNFDNNVGASAAAVAIARPFVDVAGTFAPPVSGTWTPGGKGAASLVLRNLGNTALKAPFTVRLFASADPVIDGGDAALFERTLTLSLKPSASKTVKAKFTVPESLNLAAYHLVASLDGDDANPANNAFASDGTFALT